MLDPVLQISSDHVGLKCLDVYEKEKQQMKGILRNLDGSFTRVGHQSDDSTHESYGETVAIVKDYICGKKELQLDGQIFGVYCCSDVVSIMVQDANKAISDIVDKIAGIYDFEEPELSWYNKNNKIKEALILESAGEFSYRNRGSWYDKPSKKEWKKVDHINRLVDDIMTSCETFRLPAAAVKHVIPFLLVGNLNQLGRGISNRVFRPIMERDWNQSHTSLNHSAIAHMVMNKLRENVNYQKLEDSMPKRKADDTAPLAKTDKEFGPESNGADADGIKENNEVDDAKDVERTDKHCNSYCEGDDNVDDDDCQYDSDDGTENVVMTTRKGNGNSQSTYAPQDCQIFLQAEGALELNAMGEFSPEKVSDFYDVPSADEWEKVKCICKLVESAEAVARSIFDTKYPTANIFLFNLEELRAILLQESISSDSFTSKVAKKMLQTLDKYLEDMFFVLSIASVMDPRHKMRYIDYLSSKLKNVMGNREVRLVFCLAGSSFAIARLIVLPSPEMEIMSSYCYSFRSCIIGWLQLARVVYMAARCDYVCGRKVEQSGRDVVHHQPRVLWRWATGDGDVVIDYEKGQQELAKYICSSGLPDIVCLVKHLNPSFPLDSAAAYNEISDIIDKVSLLISWNFAPVWYLTAFKLKEALELDAMGEFSSENLQEFYDVPSADEWEKVKCICFSALLGQVFAISKLIVISLTRIGDHYSLIVVVSEAGYFVT
ncbi:hypothetical protein C3L33_13038, partial [Rhododendron williamsianum]